MFVVTNRRVHENRSGLDAFDSVPSELGPNELRLAETKRGAGGKWQVEILPNIVPPALVKGENLKPRLGEDGKPQPIYASQLVAKRLVDRLKKDRTDLVLLVHGFNNDMQAVLDRAQRFEDAYGVEVLAYSWPANGGGAGALSYKSDKRDAFASAAAFSRVLNKLSENLDALNADRVSVAESKAEHATNKSNDETWNATFTEVRDKQCPFTVNMLLHSMGNYLYKHVQQSSTLRVNRLTFDNIVLMAADVNNPGHAEWVDTIHCRNRVYVTINEEDKALRASRMKAGEEQQARLGHYPFNLDARQAVYVDFTDAPKVRDSHAYFEGTPLQNKAVRWFFQQAFEGERAEDELEFDEARRLYWCG